MQTLSQIEQSEVKLGSEAEAIMRILVIDDSETDRIRILRLCDDAGLNFVGTEVATIADLRSALETTRFDLVFIDYLLAGEDGLEAIDVLNQHPEQRSASIMIAGEGQISIAVEAMRRGCSDYLTKSELTVPALQKSIATAIERQMMGVSLEEERAKRLNLEQSIRQYANSCSADMRTILAATLRRVRKLRSRSLGDDSQTELGALEDTIDRLWDALPAFSEAAKTAVRDSEDATPKLTLIRPN